MTIEGTSWCESLNADVLSWPAVRELLKSRYPAILERFARLENVDSSRLSDIRLARRAGGFAFEYWGTGGDINDVDRLLKRFSSMLGNQYEFQDGADDEDLRTKYRVLDNIAKNAVNTAAADLSSGCDVWKLTLRERHRLLDEWKEEIDLRTILDRTAEIHRRHQAAVSKRCEVLHDIDARCLQDRKQIPQNYTRFWLTSALENVIAMTMTACAMNSAMLTQLNLQTVICEEAGEVMEAQSICTLFPSVKHAIFIGDPLQLRYGLGSG